MPPLLCSSGLQVVLSRLPITPPEARSTRYHRAIDSRQTRRRSGISASAPMQAQRDGEIIDVLVAFSWMTPQNPAAADNNDGNGEAITPK